MFRARTRTSILPLAVIVAVHLAASFACIWNLSGHFYSSKRVVVLHVLVVAAGMTLAFAAIAVANQRGWIESRRLTARVLVTLIGTAGTSFLVLLYAADFVSNRVWGGNVNYELVWQYAALLLPNRPPFFVSPWVHAGILGGILFVFLIYLTSSRLVIGSLDTLIHSEGSRSTRRRTPTALTIAALIAAGSAGSTAILIWQLQQTHVLSREPIVGFFLSNDSLSDFAQYSLDRQLLEQGIEARARYPRGQAFQKKNVVIIFVDSLRADHMSVYGYERPTTPFLRQLVEEGRLQQVQMALSTCAETTCGVLSTLSSKTLRHLGPRDFSLTQLLHDQGYNVYQIFSGDHSWHGLRRTLGGEQTLYFDSTSSKRYAVNDDGVVVEGLEQVPDYAESPAFFQFHLMSAHELGVKHDRYRHFQPSALRRDFNWLLSGADDLVALTNSYDNGILEADATIQTLFEELQRKGYLQNSLVIITADHGEGLGERGPKSLRHVWSLNQEFIHIPLLIFERPQREPFANLSLAAQIDVAPTVIDRLGLAIPTSWEGQSLLKPSSERYTFHQTLRGDDCYAVVAGVDSRLYKYLRCGGEHSEELYELTTDPEERHSLVTTAPPAVIDGFRGALKTFLLEPFVGEHR